MTRYKFAIEYRMQDGERRRTVFFGGMGGIQRFRRGEIDEDGQWVRQSHVQVTAPTLEVAPLGAGAAYAGP